MNKLNSLLYLGTGLVLGIFMTAALLSSRQNGNSGNLAEADQKPIYWVAPMDPDFRRDGPGKSPMGMDLVPVYADREGGSGAGTVRISPDVVNNLGVRTAEVATGVFEPVIRTVGHVTFDENQLVHIHPRVEGWIETLQVKAEGDPVLAGEAIFELYSPTLVNAQEELLLALNRSNPDLVDAAMQRLAALKVPDSTISDVRRQRRVSQTVTIYAPRSGVVQSLAVREGMYISPGMNVMTIGPLDHVWVVGELYERQAQLVHPGDTVVLSLDYLPGRSWTGVVDYVYPSLNEQTRTVRVRTQFGNEDRALKPGMFGELRIRAIRDAQPTLLIPREALIRTGNQNRVVMALGEGRFKSIAVRPGRIGPTQAEILEGLTAGDRIVVSAQFLIDSESSRTSDFLRMSHDGDDHNKTNHGDMDSSAMERAEQDSRTESQP